MADEKSLINLGDLSQPATTLIKKVSKAVGILYEPRRIVKMAEAEARAEKIKALAEMELSEMQQRGMQRLIYQEGRKQENIEKITAEAVQNLPPYANAEDIEEDWIAHFFDKCDLVSDKDMQSLWSKLMAGEATKPGTYSKRTVDFVATMDKKDAELFTKFCQFTWMIGGPAPLIFDVENAIYNSHGINFAALKHLDAIGLISFESTSGYRKVGFRKHAVVSYFGKPFLLEFPKDEKNELQTGKALFTKAGEELVSICGATSNPDFEYYALEEMRKKNLAPASLLINK